jgi:hypothetical protein
MKKLIKRSLSKNKQLKPTNLRSYSNNLLHTEPKIKSNLNR